MNKIPPLGTRQHRETINEKETRDEIVSGAGVKAAIYLLFIEAESALSLNPNKN
jgi:hypothetical protein